MTKPPLKAVLAEQTTEALIAELARRRAAEEALDMTTMELAAEADAATLKEATMGARLARLSEEEDGKPKRCPKCGTSCRVKAKKRDRTLRTLSGAQRFQRNYYYCLSCKGGWYPLDIRLDLPASGEVTREVEKRILDFGLTEVYADSADRWNVHYQSRISENLVRRVIERVGKVLESIPPILLQKELREPVASCEELIVVGVDGSMLPMRGQDGWREVKVGVVARHANGKQLPGARYLASIGKPSELLLQMEAALDVEGACGKQAVWVSDGAPWVWSLAEKLLPDAHQILDWPHAAQHLNKCMKVLFDDTDVCGHLWIDRARQLAWNGDIETLIQELEGCLFLMGSKEHRQALIDLIRYCTTHKDRMNYRVFRDAGFPIGSGLVESAHRHVLQQRMKRAGQHWEPVRANRMAKLRAAYRTAGAETIHSAIFRAASAARELAA